MNHKFITLSTCLHKYFWVTKPVKFDLQIQKRSNFIHLNIYQGHPFDGTECNMFKNAHREMKTLIFNRSPKTAALRKRLFWNFLLHFIMINRLRIFLSPWSAWPSDCRVLEYSLTYPYLKPCKQILYGFIARFFKSEVFQKYFIHNFNNQTKATIGK